MQYDSTLNDVSTHRMATFTSREELKHGTFLADGRYCIQKLLGEGGNGQVWLANEFLEGHVLRQVVCKLIPIALQTQPLEFEKIEKSFHLTERLNHPHICPVYGLESDPVYGSFFVMAYADGGTLANWFYTQSDFKNGLPIQDVLKVLRPVAEALDFAHSQHVIHRDVKPQNIMFATVDGQEVVWLIDFGISAQIHETATMTSSQNATSGTALYMAPEQWKGQPQSAQTDQYALATIVYELLAGHTPFSGNQFALYGQVVNQTPANVPHLSSNTNATLMKALAKQPEARFKTCKEFLDTLGGEIPGEWEGEVNTQLTYKDVSTHELSSFDNFMGSCMDLLRMFFGVISELLGNMLPYLVKWGTIVLVIGCIFLATIGVIRLGYNLISDKGGSAGTTAPTVQPSGEGHIYLPPQPPKKYVPPHENEIDVQQDFTNWNIKVTNAHIHWTVLDQHYGWELQKNNNTGHCRIISPSEIRRAWGREEKMRNSFAGVKHQLDNTRRWE